jgi:phosphate starvation-inducible protein PhoH and related proteins
LTEKTIDLGAINPVEIFGPNEINLKLIEKQFPKLKFISRGQNLKVIGEEDLISAFSLKMDTILSFYHKYNRLDKSNLERILMENANNVPENDLEFSDLILFGNNGQSIKARTANQLKLVKSVIKNDMVFALGPAGTGKTYTAMAMAVRALKNKEIKKIVLTRPAVEAGENLGFLPGDLNEKLDPYLMPLFDALRDMIPGEKLSYYMENGTIQIAPLAYMRGRTLDNAFVILDEAQNSTQPQMKMFLTRMGKTAKFIITGDITQIDLPTKQPSGLIQAVKLLKDIAGIDFVYLDASDVIRHPLVKQIILKYSEINEEKTNQKNN